MTNILLITYFLLMSAVSAVGRHCWLTLSDRQNGNKQLTHRSAA